MELDHPISTNGNTLRTELIQEAELFGEDYQPDERLLMNLTFPPELLNVRRMFFELSSRRKRQQNEHGYELDKLTYLEIKAYADLMNYSLSRMDVKLINTLDDAFIIGAENVQKEIQKRQM